MDLEKVKAFISKTETDLYIYSGGIAGEGADQLITTVQENTKRRKNAALALTTFGGDPNAAYRIARFLQNTYGSFNIYVFGYCKSAGTLVALGAKEIIMSEFGELGPLDVQIPRVDELDHESGLVYHQALLTLRAHAFDFFEECYLNLKNRSGGTISTRTASTIASSMAVGLLSPLAEQIDPLKVGEVIRALNLAEEYGKRLTKNTKALQKLTSQYSAHGFVIDYKEAKELLGNVREFSADEREAFGFALPALRAPTPSLTIAFVDTLLGPTNSDEDHKGEVNDWDKQDGPGSHHHPGQSDDEPGPPDEQKQSPDPKAKHPRKKQERAPVPKGSDEVKK